MKTEKFKVTKGELTDVGAIFELYRAVAAIEGGLARTAEEVTRDYVENFVRQSLESGIIVVAREAESNQIIGEIHAYSSGLKVFAHVLGELTIAVHPEFQSLGIGKAVFTRLMKTVETERADILRVELIARESNRKAIEFYQKLGFEIEGRLQNRIRSINGGVEADIPMAWLRRTNE